MSLLPCGADEALDRVLMTANRLRETPLRLFLQASMLASDADGDEKGEKDVSEITSASEMSMLTAVSPGGDHLDLPRRERPRVACRLHPCR